MQGGSVVTSMNIVMSNVPQNCKLRDKEPAINVFCQGEVMYSFTNTVYMQIPEEKLKSKYSMNIKNFLCSYQ